VHPRLDMDPKGIPLKKNKLTRIVVDTGGYGRGILLK